jgi:hypothetical protein
MRAALICLGVVWLAAAPLMAQGPDGPLRPRPRPPTTASPKPLPPAPRIGPAPAEQERDSEPVQYAPPTDPVLAKAIEANIDFQQELPDFLCQERMTRSSSHNLGKKWKQDDVIEAEVLTVGDKVQYRDFKVDGQPRDATDFSQLGGSWSVGDYDAVVLNLFNPASRTQFTKQGPDKLGDRETLVYDYKVEQEYSHWRVTVDGRTAVPAYHGKVWIDPETGRALRLETETTYLPSDFPLASAAGVLHYDNVEIDGQSYLLTSRAENKSCQRGSAFCTRLDIEFLDYRKFSAESTLFTTDSDIEFGKQVPDQPEPKP